VGGPTSTRRPSCRAASTRCAHRASQAPDAPPAPADAGFVAAAAETGGSPGRPLETEPEAWQAASAAAWPPITLAPSTARRLTRRGTLRGPLIRSRPLRCAAHSTGPDHGVGPLARAG